MSYTIEDKLIKKLTLDKVGVFYFYTNFMISEINEGVIIDLNVVLEVTNQYTKKYYGHQVPFVYISNRVNSYSINPTIHFETAKLLSNAKGYAIVTYNTINTEVAKMEKSFLSIPTKVFSTLEDAIKWTKELIVLD